MTPPEIRSIGDEPNTGARVPQRRKTTVWLLILGLLAAGSLAWLAIRISRHVAEAPLRDRLRFSDEIALATPPKPGASDREGVLADLKKVEDLRRAATAKPLDPAPLLEMARNALASGDCLSALEGFVKALQLGRPEDTVIIEALGESQQRLGLSRAAIRTYDSVVRAAPHKVEGYVGLCRALTDLDRREEGAAVLERAAIALEAADYAGHLALAQEFDHRYNTPRALREAEIARSIAPHDAGVMISQAGLLLKLHRLDEAQRILEAVVKDHPQIALAHRVLGSILNNPLRAKRDPAGAEHHLLTAAQIDPHDTRALESLGEMYQSQSRFKPAVYVYCKLLETLPNYGSARFQLTQAYAKLGDEKSAAEQRAISLRELDQERIGAALVVKRNQHPRDYRTRIALGLHSLGAGQFRQAMEELQAAYALAPDRAEPKNALTRFYVAAGFLVPAFLSGGAH